MWNTLISEIEMTVSGNLMSLDQYRVHIGQATGCARDAATDVDAVLVLVKTAFACEQERLGKEP